MELNQLTNKEQAVIKIQRFWRRHIDVQVIKFRNRGDPSSMLRCINPSEAKLIDSATGSKVKFRLAGYKFPPNIYYKIFTCRPVQDLCANSPKDYTKPAAKHLMMRDKHNKNRPIIDENSDKENWYKRIENNGWRLVSDRLLKRISSDPIIYESHQKSIAFNCNKLTRQKDAEKRRKKRKIEWLQKMYKLEILQTRLDEDDEETIKLIEQATSGLIENVEKYGTEIVDEDEVNELLNWTTALNFDEYLTDWKEIATSASSAVNKIDLLNTQELSIFDYDSKLNHVDHLTTSRNTTDV